ncbi:aldehyde dehydrogenase family protein [Paraburkholderia sp. 40]|uniref:aldehyde dehydrogenase family protein n=1 Tax=Paraburkholderia sp. 40 TaxID=2991059 RepID=UPI003D256C41
MFENDLSLVSSATRQALDAAPRVFIDGEWHATENSLDVIDPSSGQLIARLAAGNATSIDAAVDAARRAFEHGPWPQLHAAQREALLRRLADLVERDRRVLAELEVLDVGMPLWMAGELNVGGAIDVLRYMAGLAGHATGRTVQVGVPIPGSAFFGYTQKEPLGVVGAIIPWNVPLMMSVWKLAPALAAGCTVVLKPSEEASMSVLHLAGLVREAGFPAGVVNVVTGTGASVGAALAAHPGIDKITFTGSTSTGKQVALAAARNVTKATLELGGKSPQILFADADLDTAIPGIAGSIFLNSGQVCVAGSRLYVQRRLYGEAVSRLARHADAMRMGAGLAQGTELGPLVNARQQQHVLRHLDDAQRAGAELLTAAPRVEARGFYVRPTVVAAADQQAAIVQEELFGPVITVTPFDEVDEAVQMANDTPYGLSACLWTRDLSTMHSVVPRIRSGKVAVNTEPMPWPGLPEGGRKASGHGRDLGEESFESFLEIKSVLVRYA